MGSLEGFGRDASSCCDTTSTSGIRLCPKQIVVVRNLMFEGRLEARDFVIASRIHGLGLCGARIQMFVFYCIHGDVVVLLHSSLLVSV